MMSLKMHVKESAQLSTWKINSMQYSCIDLSSYWSYYIWL